MVAVGGVSFRSVAFICQIRFDLSYLPPFYNGIDLEGGKLMKEEKKRINVDKEGIMQCPTYQERSVEERSFALLRN